MVVPAVLSSSSGVGTYGGLNSKMSTVPWSLGCSDEAKSVRMRSILVLVVEGGRREWEERVEAVALRAS